MHSRHFGNLLNLAWSKFTARRYARFCLHVHNSYWLPILAPVARRALLKLPCHASAVRRHGAATFENSLAHCQIELTCNWQYDGLLPSKGHLLHSFLAAVKSFESK